VRLVVAITICAQFANSGGTASSIRRSIVLASASLPK
jgi:hypothetical protein